MLVALLGFCLRASVATKQATELHQTPHTELLSSAEQSLHGW